MTLLEKPINLVGEQRVLRKEEVRIREVRQLSYAQHCGFEPRRQEFVDHAYHDKLRAFEAWSAQDVEQRQDMLIGLW